MAKSKLNPATQPEPTVQPLLVDADAAAVTLSLGKRKLWSLKASGELPFVQIGRRVLFATADIAAFIASNRVTGRAVS